MPGYWADNLRHTVRFAAAVQAALEDGYRVFAELAPHPLLTHAVEQTAQQPRHAAGRAGRHAPRAGAAARAARLPGGSAQRRRRGRLLGALSRWPAGGCAAADLDSPSAAVDPRRSGVRGTRRLHRCGASADGRACALAGGTGAPRLAGRGRHRGAALAGRPPDTQCGCASGGRLLRDGVGRGSHGPRRGLRSPRHPLRADAAARRRDPGRRRRVGGVARRRHLRGGDRPGRRTRAARHRGPACAPTSDQPPAHDMAALLAAHPCRVDGAELRQWFARARYSVRSGFRRSGRGAHRRGDRRARCWPRSGCPARSARSSAGYGVHPALLDACFQSVGGSSQRAAGRQRRPAAAAGRAAAARLRSYPQRPLLLHAG